MLLQMKYNADNIKKKIHQVKYWLLITHTRAAWFIECDCHAHLVSKAGSVISSKSPSPVFRWSSIYFTEPLFSDKLHKKLQTI